MKKLVIFALIFILVSAASVLIFKDYKFSNDILQNAENLSEKNTAQKIENLSEKNITQNAENSTQQTELSFEEKIWKERIDNAFSPASCPQVLGKKYGSLYYNGSLIDTHYHIPNIPDLFPGEIDEDEFDKTDPVLGQNIKITDIICTLNQENTTKVFAFFPVYSEIPEQMIEVVYQTMKNYSDKFAPFIMPPDNDDELNGSPTVDANVLSEMLNIKPGLFQGYGEIGLYARENGAKELLPDSQRLLEIYPVLREHSLIAYFHLGEGQKENFKRALQQNPDINFIFHGDQLISYDNGEQDLRNIDEILSSHPNVYYTIDELYGDEWLIKPEVTKEQFLEHLENYEVLLNKDLGTWKAIIEKHPNQFMWGTDRSDQVLWSHDPEVGQALANYARAFIARLNPEVQEKFAYKNAEKLISS